MDFLKAFQEHGLTGLAVAVFSVAASLVGRAVWNDFREGKAKLKEQEAQLEEKRHAELLANARELDRKLEDALREEITEALGRLDTMILELSKMLDSTRDDVGELQTQRKSDAEKVRGIEAHLLQGLRETRESFERIHASIQQGQSAIMQALAAGRNS